MTTLLSCKIQEAIIIKNLIELCKGIFTHIEVTIDENGITSTNIDVSNSICFNFSLPKENFTKYEVHLSQETIHVAINVHNLYNLIQSCRKKVSMELELKENQKDIYTLNIKIMPHDHAHRKDGSMTVLPSQKHIITYPCGYTSNFIHVSSQAFQTICKDMNKITDMSIRYNSTMISFHSEIDGLTETNYIFGEENEAEPINEDFYDPDLVRKLTKCSSFNKMLLFQAHVGKPLYIKTSIGLNGYISTYVKNRALIEKEKDEI